MKQLWLMLLLLPVGLLLYFVGFMIFVTVVHYLIAPYWGALLTASVITNVVLWGRVKEHEEEDSADHEEP